MKVSCILTSQRRVLFFLFHCRTYLVLCFELQPTIPPPIPCSPSIPRPPTIQSAFGGSCLVGPGPVRVTFIAKEREREIWSVFVNLFIRPENSLRHSWCVESSLNLCPWISAPGLRKFHKFDFKLYIPRDWHIPLVTLGCLWGSQPEPPPSSCLVNLGIINFLLVLQCHPPHQKRFFLMLGRQCTHNRNNNNNTNII